MYLMLPILLQLKSPFSVPIQSGELRFRDVSSEQQVWRSSKSNQPTNQVSTSAFPSAGVPEQSTSIGRSLCRLAKSFLRNKDYNHAARIPISINNSTDHWNFEEPIFRHWGVIVSSHDDRDDLSSLKKRTSCCVDDGLGRNTRKKSDSKTTAMLGVQWCETSTIHLQVHLIRFAVSTRNSRGIERPVENIYCVNTNMQSNLVTFWDVSTMWLLKTWCWGLARRISS